MRQFQRRATRKRQAQQAATTPRRDVHKAATRKRQAQQAATTPRRDAHELAHPPAKSD